MRVHLINPNGIKESYSILASEKKFTKHLEFGDVNKISKIDCTEIKIITNDDDFEALENEWVELAQRSDTHIFQTFEWNRIWWKHFGATKNLHIVAVYTGNKLAGIAPLFEDDITLFGRKVYSCLRFLGSYVSQPEAEPLLGHIPYSDYLDCIIRPGQETAFYPLILQHFKEVEFEFDEIILDEVAADSDLRITMIPLISESHCGLNSKTQHASSSPVILLNSTWEEYLNSMNVKDRYNARRYYKRSKQINKKGFLIKKIKNTEELPGVLNDLIRMHQRQWNNRGFAGTFSEKRMHDFFKEISKSFYKKDWIEFNMAVPFAEKEATYVAVDVLLTYKNRIYLMHRGMEEESAYRKHGPGNVLLFARLNEAIDDGVNVFDMLRGSEEFKVRMATKINQNRKLTLYPGTISRRILPGLVKMQLKTLRYLRAEKVHIKLMFGDKPFFKGITDYLQFLKRRINHKLNT